MLKKFFKSVLPSMAAFTFSSLYCIVDGFFVGRNVGDAGLAAVSIAYPLTALMQALGTGIGMGGAIQIATSRGKKEEETAFSFLGNTLLLLFAAWIGVTALLLFSYKPLLALMGAEGQVLNYAADYAGIMLAGAGFQIFATGCVPLLRNYDAPVLAMMSMIAGFSTNIVLDWLFVSRLSLGVAGAAWASILGQAVTLLPCLFFLRRILPFRNLHLLRPRFNRAKMIFLIGLSPMGLTLSPNLALMMLNKASAVWGGAVAVAAYAVTGYVITVIYLLLQGVGDGTQPLISFYRGMGEPQKTKQLRTMAYWTALFTALLNLLLLVVLRRQIPVFFGASTEAGALTAHMLPLFAIGAVFLSFCRISTSYFYSIRRNSLAYILVYGELVFLGIFLLILPRFLGTDGVWYSVPASQFLLFVLAVFFILREKKPAQTGKCP